VLTNFFNAIGWPIFEGYGMSETSPVIAVSEKWPMARKAGSVGPALPGVQIKISPENNEICCKGHNVMMGYYKDPERTKEVIDSEGWFHTGDTGRFDKHKRLYITGRIKSLFKTSMGKYINPEVLEQKYCESPLIDQMMVVGENQKFAAALVVPNFDNLREAAKAQGLEAGTNIQMANNTKITRLVAEDMKKFDSNFGDWERIKKIKLISDEWNQESGIITPTLKLRRNVILERYANEIEQLFA
jgi:long-chain acyl-CoA synthetase